MLNKMTNIQLSIYKATESSGNQQFFCRANRLDVKNLQPKDKLAALLELACFQTKHLDINECMSRAWFTISYSSRFFGIPMDEIKLINFTKEEEEYTRKQLALR